MGKAIRAYVRFVDRLSRYVGLFAMYMIFAMMAVLLYSSITKTLFVPPLWVLDISEFLMVAYFLLGGAHSMQLDQHVRMDLFYSAWSERTRALVDAFTIFFLIFYLAVVLKGGVSSTIYAIVYGEVNFSAWRPQMWPIKVIMVFGITLMLLQAIATFFKDIAKLRGDELR
jgi:TRAP-type mannitol/chloroaromatic compound transport system permease small subunit